MTRWQGVAISEHVASWVQKEPAEEALVCWDYDMSLLALSPNKDLCDLNPCLPPGRVRQGPTVW